MGLGARCWTRGSRPEECNALLLLTGVCGCRSGVKNCIAADFCVSRCAEERSRAQVLDEEDLIQECKALNGRLIAFLKQPPVLGALLGYLVDAPQPSTPRVGFRVNHKPYPEAFRLWLYSRPRPKI